MKSYKIGDILIGINSDIKFNNYDILDKFIYNKNDEEYDALYKIKISNPFIFENEKMIFKNSTMKIYKDGKKTSRVYGMNDLFGDLKKVHHSIPVIFIKEKKMHFIAQSIY